jgi:DNA-binding NarL/FixJ family response regulator
MRYLIGQSRPIPSGMRMTIGAAQKRKLSACDSPIPAMFGTREESVADPAHEDVVENAKILALALSEILTERQTHVLDLLRNGLSNKLIARKLEMTEATVKVHVRHLMRKLGAANRTEVAVIATRLSSSKRGNVVA